jgi:hypothetical protein
MDPRPVAFMRAIPQRRQLLAAGIVALIAILLDGLLLARPWDRAKSAAEPTPDDQRGADTTCCGRRSPVAQQFVVVGWRGRIRTFDLLIQSQTPESGLASHLVSVEDSDLCPIPG